MTGVQTCALPISWGYGDPSQRKIPAEFSTLKHVRGTLSAARSTDPNSATSQFFICVVPYPSLDGKYSIYGEVLEGMNIVDYIVNVPRDANNNPLVKVEMKIIKLDPNEVKDNGIDNNLINIYPNPANTTLFIRTKTEFISKYEILDLFGQQMQTGMVSNSSVNISNLPNGTYLLKINNSVTKFLVSR